MATTTLARHLLGGSHVHKREKKEQEMEITRVSSFFPFLLCVEGRQTKGERENGPVAMAIYIRLALQTHKVLTLVKPPESLE